MHWCLCLELVRYLYVYQCADNCRPTWQSHSSPRTRQWSKVKVKIHCYCCHSWHLMVIHRPFCLCILWHAVVFTLTPNVFQYSTRALVLHSALWSVKYKDMQVFACAVLETVKHNYAWTGTWTLDPQIKSLMLWWRRYSGSIHTHFNNVRSNTFP